MDSSKVRDRLDAATNLEGEDVAIRVRAEYRPQAGTGAKVYPPTYIATNAGQRYHFEERWDASGKPATVVVLDSVQSEANRAETALLGSATELGLPQLEMRTEVEDRTVTVSSLEAPHRSRDAYFLDSELDGVPFDKTAVGSALKDATATDATPYLRHAPYDLVFGVWDSHRGARMPTKFPRAITSEMLGWHTLQGKTAATKDDPLNLPGKDEVSLAEWRPDLQTKNKKNQSEKLSELGFGMVPVAPDEATGGVAVSSITRTAVLSLNTLAALSFPTETGDATRQGRVALAALALLADRLAFGRPGLTLRSGSELVLGSESVEWVQQGERTEPLDLDVESAIALFSRARDDLAEAGVAWDPQPVTLRPAPRLQQLIEQTFYTAELNPEE
jgi:CRISPR-associated protein Csb1